MKVNVKAFTDFQHGRLSAEKDGTYPLPKGEADDLVKVGLVEIVNTEDGEVQNPMGEPQAHEVGDVVTDPPHEDLLDGEKQATSVKNKMAKAPANKSDKA